jgi:hypothetical protein
MRHLGFEAILLIYCSSNVIGATTLLLCRLLAATRALPVADVASVVSMGRAAVSETLLDGMVLIEALVGALVGVVVLWRNLNLCVGVCSPCCWEIGTTYWAGGKGTLWRFAKLKFILKIESDVFELKGSMSHEE